MAHLFNLNSPLHSIFWTKDNQRIKEVFLILAGVILLAAASQLSIPLIPVPLTFQSATVALIGMAFGARRGAYVVACYLLAGSLGLPVFADFSAGFMKFVGPTGGYLAGFLPAVWVSGYLAEKGLAKSVLGSFLAACVGVSIIFFFGVSFLSTFTGFEKAIQLGLLPFMASEPFKLAALALVVPKLWKSTH